MKWPDISAKTTYRNDMTEFSNLQQRASISTKSVRIGKRDTNELIRSFENYKENDFNELKRMSCGVLISPLIFSCSM